MACMGPARGFQDSDYLPPPPAECFVGSPGETVPLCTADDAAMASPIRPPTTLPLVPAWATSSELGLERHLPPAPTISPPPQF